MSNQANTTITIKIKKKSNKIKPIIKKANLKTIFLKEMRVKTRVFDESLNINFTPLKLTPFITFY